MLITMYKAAQVVGLTNEAIRKKQNQLPKPGYFVEVIHRGKHTNRVDDQHPEWKAYVKNREMEKTLKGETIEGKEKKLFLSVYTVLNESMDIEKESLMELLNKIEKVYRG